MLPQRLYWGGHINNALKKFRGNFPFQRRSFWIPPPCSENTKTAVMRGRVASKRSGTIKWRVEASAGPDCEQRFQSPHDTAGEPNRHWVNRGDIAKKQQSDWGCQWKSGEVKGHQRRWPAQLPDTQWTWIWFLSVMQLGLQRERGEARDMLWLSFSVGSLCGWHFKNVFKNIDLKKPQKYG